MWRVVRHGSVPEAGTRRLRMGLSFTGIVVIIVVLYFLSSIKILAEYERGVIFRLGR
jgi:regulator of protease activity HflC (stomatin/prohibitin superfamily)